MTRERLVLGNWKMNPSSRDEAIALADAVRAAMASVPSVSVGVAAPTIFLASVATALHGSHVAVYAQDVHWEERGAYTGQTAASMLRGSTIGSIVGHSEMRRDQRDDDDRVARKALRALGDGLRAVVCVGESEAEYIADETTAVVTRQTAAVVRALRTADPDGARTRQLVFAYEPIWAIGTGRAATAEHASMAARSIRAAAQAEGIDGEGRPILYGGSVTAANAVEFARADGIDGALVGGASLKAQEFGAIVVAFAK